MQAHPGFCLHVACERLVEESSSTETVPALFSRMQFPKQRESLETSYLKKCTCRFSTLYLIIVFKLTPAHLEPIKIIISCSIDYPGRYKRGGIAWEYPNNSLVEDLSLHRSTLRSSRL